VVCRQQSEKGGPRLLSKTIRPGVRQGFTTPVNRYSFFRTIKMPSAGRLKAPLTTEIVVRVEFLMQTDSGYPKVAEVTLRDRLEKKTFVDSICVSFVTQLR